jgi:8-oxo-dGTP pyrophosphatase MutT (NUDIX family)
VTFEGSYLWRLRQKVGSELVLMPGAMIVLRRDDGRVLLLERSDDHTWCVPSGGCEPGQSFIAAAIAEVHEEVGIRLDAAHMHAFASLSDPQTHTLTYEGGDVTHWFALCFLVERWDGEPVPDGDEALDVTWADPAAPPEAIHKPSLALLGLLAAYERTGRFQAA